MDKVTGPKKLPCGHTLCTDCIEAQFAYKQACPTCGAVCWIITGRFDNDVVTPSVPTVLRLSLPTSRLVPHVELCVGLLQVGLTMMWSHILYRLY